MKIEVPNSVINNYNTLEKSYEKSWKEVRESYIEKINPFLDRWFRSYIKDRMEERGISYYYGSDFNIYQSSNGKKINATKNDLKFKLNELQGELAVLGSRKQTQANRFINSINEGVVGLLIDDINEKTVSICDEIQAKEKEISEVESLINKDAKILIEDIGFSIDQSDYECESYTLGLAVGYDLYGDFTDADSFEPADFNLYLEDLILKGDDTKMRAELDKFVLPYLEKIKKGKSCMINDK